MGEHLHLDVLLNAGVHSLLETWVLTSKVLLSAKVVATGLASFVGQGGIEGAAHALACTRQKDDLAVGGLGHRLHSLEVSDLHGRSRAQDVGSLSHEFGGFNLETG